MKQANNILLFPHRRAEKLSKKRKPRLCFPEYTIYNLVVIVTEWAVIVMLQNMFLYFIQILSAPVCIYT